MGRRKAVDNDVVVPSTRKRKNHMERATWIEKYKDVAPDAIRAAGYEVSADGLPLMPCAKCGKNKERTTDFFAANGVRGNLTMWFGRPFPWMKNSVSHPCNACSKLVLRIRRRDVDGDGWLLHLLRPYKLPLGWGKEFYLLPDGNERCWATGGTLPFVKGSNAFSLGVNSVVVQDGKYDRNKSHAIEDCVPCYQFANCMQSVPGPNGTKVVIIPSLREAYAELYRRVIDAFRLERHELEKRGDEQASKMKSWADFHGMVSASKQNDKARGINNDVTSVRVLSMVKEQHAICHTSGIIMTTFSASGGIRGSFDVHMDRIDDAYSLNPKGHVASNIELKCRLFNNDHSITRKDFLLLFMNQVLVPVPEDVRDLARAEYNGIPCSSRDAWNHAGAAGDA